MSAAATHFANYYFSLVLSAGVALEPPLRAANLLPEHRRDTHLLIHYNITILISSCILGHYFASTDCLERDKPTLGAAH